jgi:putative membrane protein
MTELAELPRLLLGTLVLRPYVFGFLALHAAGASALLGWRRTIGFTLVTWAVALAAEHSSIRTGIPFGWYHYLPHTAGQELWVAGVPFFDSLSFSFLMVASYGLAWVLLAGPGAAGRQGGRPARLPRPGRGRHLLLAAALMVLIDVLIDPVALRGDRWFLGQIYGYPEPGLYFGVPVANFVGWGVVGLAATALYHAWERRCAPLVEVRLSGRGALCPGLYLLVALFNLTITAALGEWRLLACGVAWMLPILGWVAVAIWGLRVRLWRPGAEGTWA